MDKLINKFFYNKNKTYEKHKKNKLTPKLKHKLNHKLTPKLKHKFKHQLKYKQKHKLNNNHNYDKQYNINNNKTKNKLSTKYVNKKNKSSKKLKGGALGGTVCAPNIMVKEQIFDSNKHTNMIKPIHTSSCLTESALNKLVRAWNKDVDNPKYKINSSKSQKEIYEDIVKIFNQTNSRLLPEHEWWEQPWVTKNLSNNEIEEIKYNHYSPEAPETWHQNPNEWLSTLDIDAKLEQYESKYPEFKYYVATPIDFDLKSSSGNCSVNPLCNINLKSLLAQKKPKKYIGVVFNMDKHNEPGSHWIALFVNVPKKEINYWDSYAVNPQQEIVNLMNKLVKQGKSLNPQIHFTKKINNVRHQFKGSECGVYSCNFIIEQLEGKRFEDVINKIVSDDAMNKRRWIYYNK